MKRNTSKWDRFLRIFSGTLLLTWAIAGGPFWSYIGLILIMTGAWGFCPIYHLLKFRTSKK